MKFVKLISVLTAVLFTSACFSGWIDSYGENNPIPEELILEIRAGHVVCDSHESALLELAIEGVFPISVISFDKESGRGEISFLVDFQSISCQIGH